MYFFCTFYFWYFEFLYFVVYHTTQMRSFGKTGPMSIAGAVQFLDCCLQVFPQCVLFVRNQLEIRCTPWTKRTEIGLEVVFILDGFGPRSVLFRVAALFHGIKLYGNRKFSYYFKIQKLAYRALKALEPLRVARLEGLVACDYRVGDSLFTPEFVRVSDREMVVDIKQKGVLRKVHVVECRCDFHLCKSTIQV